MFFAPLRMVGYRAPDGKITLVKPRIRLLAVDIDGTLLDSTYKMPAANREALQRARQAGVEVVLVTGRRHTFALTIARELGFDCGLITSNGAITRTLAGETLYRDMLPTLTARRVCERLVSFRRNLVITFDVPHKGALVMESLDGMAASIRPWLEKNIDYIEFVVPIESSLRTDPVQAMVCGGIAAMKEAEARLRSADFVAKFNLLRTRYDHRDLCILDVLNRGCSKGHALRRWVEARGWTRDDVMAIGDNYNDVEMLEFAGLPVIMGNASSELRQNGWQLTATNDQAGVAAAVEQHLGL